MYETAVYAARNLTIAYGFGYAIGTAIHWLIETYTPELDNAIGSMMDSIITNLENPYSPSGVIGMWEEMLNNSAFRVPLGDLYNSGDWGGYGVLDDATSLFDTESNTCITYGCTFP